MAQCLVDDVLPVRRVHLLGGVSDAGKTRFIIPALLEWERGKPFLGRASHPVPWAYVAGDRPLSEAQDTVASMNLNSASIRMIAGYGLHNRGWYDIVRAAKELVPVPQLLVIEGFSDLPPGETKRDVRAFLSDVSAYCESPTDFPAGLTVIGVVESPKLKPNERYSNPRQRISGVSSWGFHTSTVILIESEDAEYTKPDRTVWACMKGAPRLKLQGSFDLNGRLVVP